VVVMMYARSPRSLAELRAVKQFDWSAAADRIELFLDLLAECQVGKNVRVDYRVAARAVDYCRQRAAGKKYKIREREEREMELYDFLYAHGQSATWVFTSDPTEMMAQLAAGTCSRKPPQLRVV